MVSRLNVAELRQLLEETQSRYTNDTDRILRVADFLLSGLDNCSLQVCSTHVFRACFWKHDRIDIALLMA